MSTVDLDDNSNCPRADRCENCGTANQLQPATFDTTVGVLCTTLCISCGKAGLPPISIHAAARRVLGHCEHLGIDLDQAAAMRAEERGEDPDRG